MFPIWLAVGGFALTLLAALAVWAVLYGVGSNGLE